MSVFIKVLKSTLEQKPNKKIFLAVYSENQDIKSKEVEPTTSPNWNFTFVCSNKIRVITFTIEEQLSDTKTHLIGKFQYFLANLLNEIPNKKIIKDIELKKSVKDSEELTSSIRISAGIIRLQIQYTLKKSFIGELETFLPLEDDNHTFQQPLYEEISMSMNQNENDNQKVDTLIDKFNSEEQYASKIQRKRPNSEEQNLSFILADDGCIEINSEPAPKRKNGSPQSQKSDQTKELRSEEKNQTGLNERIEPHQITESIVKQSYKWKNDKKMNQELILNFPKNKDNSILNHDNIQVPKQQKVSTHQKLKIFKKSPILQTNHIQLNKASEMFDVYNMCCAEAEDSKYQVQDEL